MLTGLSAWPARHPALALSILGLLAVLGLALTPHWSFERLVSAPGGSLRVHAELPGVESAGIEAIVTRPLEDALSSSAGLQQMVSRSREGQATIELRFFSVDAREAALDIVRRQLAQSASILPVGMKLPTVERYDSSPLPAAVYAITAESLSHESGEVAAWVERRLARPFQELPEVATVTLDGADGHEVLIQPDPRRLATLGLSLEDLMQALQRDDQVSRRRSLRRSTTVMPASAEAVAARAVRLADGEPIALAEVAQVSVVSRPAMEHPRYRDVPALMLRVYPRSAAQAPVAAERTHAHLGWLRANEQLQTGVGVHLLFDESREHRTLLRQVTQGAGAALAAAVLVVYLFFGGRASLVVLCAFGVWLPASITLLWATGFSLNVTTAAALMIGGVVLVLLTLRPFTFTAALLVVVGAAMLPWIAREPFDLYAPTATILLLTSVLGALISWLMTPWLGTAHQTVAPFVRWMRRRGHKWSRPLAVLTTMVLVLSIVVASVRAFPVAVGGKGGMLVLRLQGEDPQQLAALANDVSSPLRATAVVQDVVVSSAMEPSWRLQLDMQVLEQLGIGVAEVGRAFAIARDGLVVGEIADADARLPLRLQFAPDAAGKSFEQLLLRGERKHQPAVYLRDVGIAEQVTVPRESVRVQRVPTVEITARWRTAQMPRELARWREMISLPAGYVPHWNSVRASVDPGNVE